VSHPEVLGGLLLGPSLPVLLLFVVIDEVLPDQLPAPKRKYFFLEDVDHRVDRVLGFFSSRPNWDSPTPSPADEHSLAGVGGVPFSTRGHTLWCSRYISTL